MPDNYLIYNQLRKIVRAVRSSPQRKQGWLEHVADLLQKKTPDAERPPAALMLILDVRTRWSSTHQMMSKRFNIFKIA
jgi:hypothetical protein